MNQVLSLNVGRKVQLKRGLETYEGKVLTSNEEFVALDVDGHTQLISPFKLEIVSGDLNLNSTGFESTRSVRFRIKAGQNATIRMLSIEAGLSWSPSYLLDLGEKGECTLKGKCTLVNDLADVDGQPLRLVTGSPSLLHGGIEPLFQTGLVPTNINFLTYDPNSNTIWTRGPKGESELNGGGGIIPASLGGSNEDLFYYDLPPVELKKGERSYQALFTKQASFDHLYTLDIFDGEESQPRSQVPFNVWHNIRFHNSLGQPLAFAPILVISKDEVIGQGLLNYTTVGGEALIAIANASEIQADCILEEVTRSEVPRLKGHGSVLTITMKGTIRLTNHKDEMVRIRTTKAITGEVLANDAQGKVTKIAPGLTDLNPRSKILWEMDIPASGTTTLTYTYKVLSSAPLSTPGER